MAVSSHRLLHYHNYIIKSTIFFFFFSTVHGFTPGSSFSVESNRDVLVSPNGIFTAGFHRVGPNAYCLAVWFSDLPTTTDNGFRTVVWMANRDTPVNGKHSKLSLFKDGNLVLTDAGQYIIWQTQTKSTSSSLQLQLQDTGNLVLLEQDQEEEPPLWQSFDFPTDTLLPGQILSKNTQLVSSRSSTNYSSGFYKLFFDIDSVLRLHYEGQETTSFFWPDPGLLTWEAGRYQYKSSRKASLDSNGRFSSSDGFGFLSADFGIRRQRMMKIDTDGNMRVYSLVEHPTRKKWEVQWQAISHSCKIHGVCGPNSLCTYSQDLGRRCRCLHGFKMVKSDDWSYGCEPEFDGCKSDDDFIELRHAEFYGYDTRLRRGVTLESCKQDCLQDCNCKGFQFGFYKGGYYCYLKYALHNGFQLGYDHSTYIKLPKTFVSSFHQIETKTPSFVCPGKTVIVPLIRLYEEKHGDEQFEFVFELGCTIGFIEIVSILFFWYNSRHHSVSPDQIYFPAATAFRKFTYSELKKASRNFREEIGRGGGSIVYKGRLSDNRIAAIKKLKNINNQGEAEFQAEISTIGRLNHKNLIETWGYCAEGKHRLVVYQYMKNGSLADNLRLGKLDWETRFEIAKGVAKGLAYLHEECLEWVLHCDVKPHNILLDDNYNPKVADFGLSRLFDRGGIDMLKFSTIRGTRGYMAPEWVLNLPITSKVDVFSYGVVVLEMITGRSSVGEMQRSDEKVRTGAVVIEWVRDQIRDDRAGSRTGSWVEEVVDCSMSDEYDRATAMNLVRIALQCVEEDMKVRPTMRQVVNMLLHPEKDL